MLKINFIRPLALLFLITNVFVQIECAEEFQLYRMQQYDVQGAQYGSRATLISAEAKTVHSNSLLARKCILIKLKDLTIEQFRELLSQSVNSIIVILPNKYSNTDKENIKFIEASLLKEAVKIPVYFTLESDEILKYYEYVNAEQSSKTESALSGTVHLKTCWKDETIKTCLQITSLASLHSRKANLLKVLFPYFKVIRDSIFMNGFQFNVNTQQSNALSDFQPTNIQGRLLGQASGQKPVKNIIITAHYDAIGMSTSLAYGCDSNGSGAVALLELARVFSYLYSNMKTVPGYNLVFLLTSVGKFNYFGTKKWLDEQSETKDVFGKIDLEETAFAISLDSLANGDGINMHVSRPPKDNLAAEFLKKLEDAAAKYNVKFEMIHKKINLANEQMAWEHERFSLNKVSGFTLSHFNSHKDTNRATMTDTRDSVNAETLTRNIKVIADALGQFIYNSNDSLEIFRSDLSVSGAFVESWLDYICSIPRSASLLTSSNSLVNGLYSHFQAYLKDSLKLSYKINPREPEFVFYSEEQASLVISKVKPAVFDLFLSLVIVLYLGLVYLFVLNFSDISYFACSIIKNNTKLSKTKLN